MLGNGTLLYQIILITYNYHSSCIILLISGCLEVTKIVYFMDSNIIALVLCPKLGCMKNIWGRNDYHQFRITISSLDTFRLLTQLLRFIHFWAMMLLICHVHLLFGLDIFGKMISFLLIFFLCHSFTDKIGFGQRFNVPLCSFRLG